MGSEMCIRDSVEINRDDARQAAILSASSHFNPVDLAVCLRDLDGRPIPLLAHADPGRHLRAVKTVDGEPVDVIEYPGLWNGGMSTWITFFVDHPAVAFAPVKTISDLRSPSHVP